MDLPFFKKREESKEYFLVLSLSSGKIGAILFEKTGSSLIILGKKETEIDSPLDTLEHNTLIENCDIVISEVESVLPETAHLEKTIFAVPQRWIEEGKIKKNHLISLKKVCEALELSPVGFIVSIEALSAYLHKLEGAPITAIFIEIGEKLATVSIVKNGNLIFVEEKEIEEDSVKTAEEVLLTQEATEVLPAKIILLNYDRAKSIQQKFLTHSWNKQLPFLHIPQVEVLNPEIESEAIINGVANQMGFEDVGNFSSSIASKASKKKGKEVYDENEKSNDDETSRTPVFSGNEVGFFREKDVKKEKVTQSLISEDEPVINVKKDEASEEENYPPEKSSSGFAFKLPSFISSIKISSVVSPSSIVPLKNKIYFYPIFALMLLVLTGFLYYFIFEKATVTLYLDKESISKDIPVVFSAKKKSSTKDGIIGLETRTITIEGEESKKATGIKETGEKAKGEVTILSSQNKEINISEGSVLRGPNSLEFILDSDIKIASSSGLSDIKSAKVKVTASKFGKEYNLPSNSKFSVAGFDTSSVEGKNDSAFSGGSSKEITVVSQEDLQELDNSFLLRFNKDALSKVNSEKDPDEEILQKPLSTAFDKKNYSKKAGDEASDVKLTGAITFEFGVYRKSDLLTFAKEATHDEGEDKEFSEEDSKVSIKDIEDKNGEVSAVFEFTAVYLPKIDTSHFTSKIAGKNFERAIEILDIEGVKNVDVEFTRGIALFPKILPFNKNNIKIELQASP